MGNHEEIPSGLKTPSVPSNALWLWLVNVLLQAADDRSLFYCVLLFILKTTM